MTVNLEGRACAVLRRQPHDASPHPQPMGIPPPARSTLRSRVSLRPRRERAPSTPLLPYELWLEIQRHADGKSLLGLRGTCHTLRALRPPMSQLVCRLQALDPCFRPPPDADGESLMAHLATRLHTIDDVAACIREPGALRPARSLSGHEDAVVSASFSPDGRFVVTASGDGTAKVWDLHANPPAARDLVGHGGWVWSASFSPDGRFVATASYDGTAKVWDLHANPPAARDLVGHGDLVQSA